MKFIRPSAAAVDRMSVIALTVAALAFALELLRMALNTYTGGDFRYFDYGLYVNFIWNLAHGNGFLCVVNDTYLSNHLSFTLALLAPVFWIWNDPLVLVVVKTLVLAGGALLVTHIALRAGAPAVLAAALGFFCIAYRFPQNIYMSEFHGVDLYLLLMPWLMACLVRQSWWGALPLLLILGIREDAFLGLLPMLSYFAFAQKQKAARVYLVVTLLYGVLALLVLFPIFTGGSVFARRARDGSIAAHGLALLGSGILHRRGLALTFTLIPILAWWPRRWGPALGFPALALIQAMLSGIVRQQSLGIQYSAPVMTLLVCGLLEALRRGPTLDRPAAWRRTIALLAVTLIGHFHSGYAWGGNHRDPRHLHLHPSGLEARELAARIPPDGLVVASPSLAAFASARRSIIDWPLFEPKRHSIRFAFLREDRIPETMHLYIEEGIRRGEWSLRDRSGPFVVLERNPGELADWATVARHRLYFAGTPTRHASDVRLNGRAVRHWPGNGSRAPADVSHGAARLLPPGQYQAVLRYRAETPARRIRGTWGRLSLHALGAAPALASLEIPTEPTPPGTWRELTVDFDLPAPTELEPRLTAGDAALWFDCITFHPR